VQHKAEFQQMNLWEDRHFLSLPLQKVNFYLLLQLSAGIHLAGLLSQTSWNLQNPSKMLIKLNSYKLAMVST
jgi:hypothetical protein